MLMASRVLLVLAVCVAAAIADHDLLHLRSLSGYPLAKCLDGTPAGYYISQSPPSKEWVVYFQGGGYCTSVADCTARLTTPLGSSNYFTPTSHGIDQITEIYNGNPVENPDFSHANRIFVPYCSGDALLGTRTSNNIPGAGAWSFYFSGHYIVQAVFDDLKATYGLGDGPDHKVIFGGRSAGGIGVLQHLNWAKTYLAPTQVTGYINAGFIIDIEDYAAFLPQYESNTVPTGPTSSALNAGLPQLAYILQPFLEPGCAAQNAANPLMCAYTAKVLPWITVPVFFANAYFDTFQIFITHGTPEAFTPPVSAYAFFFASNIAFQLNSLPPSVGVFACSCLTHGVNFTTTTVQGQTLAQTFSNWYFVNGLTRRVLDAPPTLASPEPNNPRCNGFPFGVAGPPVVIPEHGCSGMSVKLSKFSYFKVTEAGYPVISKLSIPGVFTVTMWVRDFSAPLPNYGLFVGPRTIISNRGGSWLFGEGWQVNFVPDSSDIRFIGAGADFCSEWSLETPGECAFMMPSSHFGVSVPHTLHEWTFIAARFDGTTATLTVNDVTNEDTIAYNPDYTGPQDGHFNGPAELYVGRKNRWSHNDETYLTNAYMAELGIWTRVLSPAEVQHARDGNAKLVDVADRIVLAYPVTDTFGKNVRTDQSSFLFKSTSPVVQDTPQEIIDRCASGVPSMRK